MLSIVLAFASSLGYGVADFMAGRVAKRLDPALMVLYSQAAQAIVVLLFAAQQPFAATALMWSMLAGLLNAVGLILYYQALAQGPAGIVAPLVSTSMVVPVVVAVASGTLTSPLTLVGLGIVFMGVIVAVMRSHAAPATDHDEAASPCRGAQRMRGAPQPTTTTTAAFLVPALVATLAFGGFFLLVDRGSATAGNSVLWVTLGVQIGALPPTLLRVWWSGARHVSMPVSRAVLVPVGILSAFNLGADVALTYALALGNVGIVSVLASLGPVVTGTLARFASNERLTRRQALGAGLTLMGMLLVSYAG